MAKCKNFEILKLFVLFGALFFFIQYFNWSAIFFKRFGFDKFVKIKVVLFNWVLYRCMRLRASRFLLSSRQGQLNPAILCARRQSAWRSSSV